MTSCSKDCQEHGPTNDSTYRLEFQFPLWALWPQDTLQRLILEMTGLLAAWMVIVDAPSLPWLTWAT